MELKPQDLLVALKLAAHPGESWSFHILAASLGMSPSEVHACVKRGLRARLLSVGDEPRTSATRAHRAALLEFLIHGAKYAFVPERGALTMGIPTAHAAPPLDALLTPTNHPPPVWPHPTGKVVGESFSPIYRAAPGAAAVDPKLHELLALLDAIRGGRARERTLAQDLLTKAIRHEPEHRVDPTSRA